MNMAVNNHVNNHVQAGHINHVEPGHLNHVQADHLNHVQACQQAKTSCSFLRVYATRLVAQLLQSTISTFYIV